MMKEDPKMLFLNQQIQSVKKRAEETLCTAIAAVHLGKSQYDSRIESKYRDFLDGIGKKPELDISNPKVELMVARVELERYINEHFVEGIHIYLKDKYGDLEAYIMYQVFEPRYGWDMVSCGIDFLYQEIKKTNVITEEQFLKVCNYKSPKSHKRSH